MKDAFKFIISLFFALTVGFPLQLSALNYSDAWRPDSSTLQGEFHPSQYESNETRLLRQAAENLLLQHFGLNTVGFAPNASRHPQSMFSLIYEAVERKLTYDLRSTPNANQMEQFLEQLLIDASAREAVAPHLAGIALKALQVPPNQFDTPPAVKSLQEQFAVYYTNERRKAADWTYKHWDLYRCGKLQGMTNSGLGGLLTGSYISKKGFDALLDPLKLGELGAKKIKPYQKAMHKLSDPNSPAQTAEDIAITAGLSGGMAITGTLGSVFTLIAINAAIAGKVASGMTLAGAMATNVSVAKSLTTAAVQTGQAALSSASAGTAGFAIAAVLLAAGGIHTANVVNTVKWENGLKAQREYIATQDPVVLYGNIQDALNRNDETFQSELLLLMLKMLIVEPARLQRDSDGESDYTVLNGPMLPAEYAPASSDYQLSVENGQNFITLPNGNKFPYVLNEQNQIVVTTDDGSTFILMDVDVSTGPQIPSVTLDDSLDKLPLVIGCEVPGPPSTPFATPPNHLNTHMGSNNTLYQRVLPPAEPGPPASRTVISLRSAHGKYVVAEDTGDMNANRTAIGPWEKFDLITNSDGTVSFLSHHGKYVSARTEGNLVANVDTLDAWEKFTRIDNSDGTVSFLSNHGKYVSARPEGDLVANVDTLDTWEKFHLVTVLSVSLLGAHGTYVVAEADGSVNANRTSVGPSETFELITNSDGTVSFLSHHGKYVSARSEGTLVADVDVLDVWEKFTRVDNLDGTASFRSAHGKYLVAEPDGGMNANRDSISEWEKFHLKNTL